MKRMIFVLGFALVSAMSLSAQSKAQTTPPSAAQSTTAANQPHPLLRLKQRKRGRRNTNPTKPVQLRLLLRPPRSSSRTEHTGRR